MDRQMDKRDVVNAHHGMYSHRKEGYLAIMLGP